MSRDPSRPRLDPAIVRLALPTAGIVYIVALATVRGGFRDPAVGPFIATDPTTLIAHVVGGGALIAAGSLSLLAGVSMRAGVIALVAGMAWFAPDIVRLLLAQGDARGLGPAAVVVVLPLLLHLVETLTAKGAPRGRRRLTAFLIALDLGAIIVAVVWVLTYAPLYDIRCVTSCNDPVAPIEPGSAGRELRRVATQLVALAAGSGLVVLGLARLRGPRRSTPRVTVLAGALLTGVTAIGLALGRLRPDGQWGLDGATVSTTGPLDPVVYQAGAAGATLIAIGLALLVRQTIGAKRRIRELAAGMATAPSPGSLAASLASALEDPGLRVGYRTGEGDSCVGPQGEPFDPALGIDRMATTIADRESPLGTIDDADDIDVREVASAFGPSILVAFDNERLLATQLAQLRDLQASRARIVEVADAERRRIERDLHDGAQQRLLAIAFDLRLGRLTAEKAGRHIAATALEGAERQALGLVDELRRICQSIHPQVLAQAGLGPALASLAEEAPIAVDIEGTIGDRPPVAVETAAYHLVTEALDLAVQRGARALIVELAREEDALAIVTTDWQAQPIAVPIRIADRVGALGGWVVTGVAPRGAFLRAVLPCA